MSIATELSRIQADRNTIRTKLVELGYKNTSLVNKTGEFSFRGSIIDIFPLNNTNPIRLDFFAP